MSDATSAWIVLLLVVAGWSLGSVLVYVLDVPGAGILLAPLLAAGGYWVARAILPLFGRRRRRGEIKYWRGRRIDDE